MQRDDLRPGRETCAGVLRSQEQEMTPAEFKAWFDGFTEAFTGVPTKAQWARVKERVAEIDGKPVTERVFIDRYWPNWARPYHPLYAYGVAQGLSNTGGSLGAAYQNALQGQNMANAGYSNQFNSATAMHALGKADAAASTN